MGEPEKLASSYRRSMQVAIENNVKTIAFPNISTGVYGYPKKDAAQIAIDTVEGFLLKNRLIQKVVFAVFDNENLGLYQGLLMI